MKEGSEKKKILSASYIHHSIKKKIIEREKNAIKKTPLSDILDEYYYRLMATVEEGLRRGYTIRVNGLFSLRMRIEKQAIGGKRRVKGYIRFSDKFKRSCLDGSLTSNFVVEVVNKNTGEVLLNVGSARGSKKEKDNKGSQ
jgi:hypothetical protein